MLSRSRYRQHISTTSKINEATACECYDAEVQECTKVCLGGIGCNKRTIAKPTQNTLMQAKRLLSMRQKNGVGGRAKARSNEKERGVVG